MSDPTAQAITAATNVPSETPVVPAEPVSVDTYKALKAEEASTAGVELQKIAVRDREFRVAPQLPGIILLDLGLASDPNSTQGEQLRAIRQFLHAAIYSEDVDAFEAFLRNAQPVIEMDELNKIVEELVTKVAGRPTE